MTILCGALTGQALVNQLHTLTKSAKHRVWIASPYIGSWRAVRRILHSAWERVDARLLIDEESGCLARDTVERFATHRPVRSLTGLHAKLYIVDDVVLLTSANLTESAFAKRHEVGMLLADEQAAELISAYVYLWNLGHDVDIDKISFSKPNKGMTVDEGHKGPLPKLFSLPPSSEGATVGAGEFADYYQFLEQYRLFADAYVSCGGRDHPNQPLYFETDKFLNFLFHHGSEPSKEYASRKRRVLVDANRLKEIQKYRALYREAGFPGGNHSRTAKLVRRHLSKAKVMLLTREEIKEISERLNCFGNRRNLSRFLKGKGNHLATVRRSWSDLVHGSDGITFRMNKCKTALFGFGKAATQELLGYYDPICFPLRNRNTNAGLRFLGYDVKAK